ncbi:Alternative oxidase [Mycena indigotica]|uniref:Alternative oxidase n=1 Tax=Mycena indigotica TaxID=2126181 RepID=A0A8H6RYN3_9AGAR|nr:Alternative oxidase [Mycena indigotica]KAF7288990.1 Alternative oxidase [Mycena indigotica]
MSTTTSNPSDKSVPRQTPEMAQSPLRTPGPVSTVPTMVRGDCHPVYSPDELKAVEVLHKAAKTIPDKMAYRLVRLARWGFDFVSRYKQQLRQGGYIFDGRGWLNVR